MKTSARATWGAIVATTILIVGGAISPAAADDPPPLVWTAAPGFPITTSVAEVGFYTSTSTSSAFGGDELSAPVPVFQPRIRNVTAETIHIGLAMDLETPGVLEHFWDPALWASLDANFGDIGSGFVLTLAPGETWPADIETSMNALPSWPGRTVGLFHLTPDGPPDPETNDQAYITGDLLASYSLGGPFVPVRFGTEGAWFGVGIGSEASVAGTGDQLFPGVTATVTASDLTPGEELSMWLAPNFDYFYFYLLGAVLPTSAVATGTGTVGLDGVFSGTFVVPSDIDLGDYQLVIGDPAERYWPAGSYESFQITAPDATDSILTPDGESSDSIDLGLTQVAFDFPAGTTAGTTTATVSTTGPVAGEFTFGWDPPLYYHLDTTAVPGGPTTVCISYDVDNIPGSPPYLYHHEPAPPYGYQWTNITTSRSPGLVCGLTSSFSPFTLGYPLHDGSTVVPAKGVLSSDNGWDTGLHDGAYNVKMDLWWGENARIVRLLENGAVVAEQELTRNSPNAQHTSFPVVGKTNGTYVYTAELVNSTGVTTTKALTVKVKDANPAKPVLSHNNWDNDGSYTLTANLWWGTNATSAQFSQNGVPLGDPIALTAATPGAQVATLAVSGKAKGTYSYTVTFTNAAGSTTSSAITVKVTK